MDWAVNTELLDNKLSAINMEFPSDYLTLIADVRAGPAYETNDTAGISHLIEHAMLRGSDKFPKRKDIYNELSLIGYYNVYTFNNRVQFELCFFKEKLESAVEVVIDVLLKSKLNHKDLLDEKEMVLDELRLELDTPSDYLTREFNESFFGINALSRPILGYERTINSISPVCAVDFYNRVFNTSNTQVIVCGDLESSELHNLIDKHSIDCPAGGKAEKDSTPEYYKSPINKCVNKSLADAYLMTGRKLVKIKSTSNYDIEVLEAVLNKRLDNCLRNIESLSYTNQANIYHNEDYYSIYSTFKPDKYHNVISGIKRAVDECKKGSFTDYEVINAVNELKLLFKLGTASPFEKAKKISEYAIDDNLEELINYLNNFNKVTPDSVRRAGECLSLRGLTEVLLKK